MGSGPHYFFCKNLASLEANRKKGDPVLEEGERTEGVGHRILIDEA